jgi:DNA-binding PadR family transcriptional regulator
MNLLPQIPLSILMAVSLRPRHGYEIMQQVSEDSGGRIKLGPGSLYTAIQQLSRDGLVEEVPGDQPGRRRYWQLTGAGRKRLNAEIRYFDETVKLARQRNVLETRPGRAI